MKAPVYYEYSGSLRKERENLNWKKEIDEALNPILELPFDLQEILLGDLVDTVKNRVAFM